MRTSGCGVDVERLSAICVASCHPWQTCSAQSSTKAIGHDLCTRQATGHVTDVALNDHTIACDAFDSQVNFVGSYCDDLAAINRRELLLEIDFDRLTWQVQREEPLLPPDLRGTMLR